MRASDLTNRRELRTFRDSDALNRGTPQVWDLSAPVPRPRGREFLRVGELPRSPWCGGLSIHAQHWRWRRSCKSLLRMSLTFIYTMETRRVQLCTQQKLRYLEIAHRCRAISRWRTGAAQSRHCVNPVCNLKIGTQFWDSENAKCNLEIAQIPRLRRTHIMGCGTYIYIYHAAQVVYLVYTPHQIQHGI